MTLDQLVSTISNAIARQEGFLDAAGNTLATSPPAVRHNPGSIWDGLAPGKLKRIWPHIPIDGGGFLMFRDDAEGWNFLRSQVSIKVHRGETLDKLINEWDSGDPKPFRDRYVANVAAWTKLPTDRRLLDLVA